MRLLICNGGSGGALHTFYRYKHQSPRRAIEREEGGIRDRGQESHNELALVSSAWTLSNNNGRACPRRPRGDSLS